MPIVENRQVPNLYQTSIFINCPYDNKYKPLLIALIFTIVDCRFEPRIAAQSTDSSTVRLEKIIGLIKGSRSAIHDISRMEAGPAPRFNLPFEVGLDYGCKAFGGQHYCHKTFLILDRNKYRYRRVFSDLSGNDIKAHHDDPQKLVVQVRDWIRENVSSDVMPASKIWGRYGEFYTHLTEGLKEAGYKQSDIKSLTVKEYIEYAKIWKSRNPIV